MPRSLPLAKRAVPTVLPEQLDILAGHLPGPCIVRRFRRPQPCRRAQPPGRTLGRLPRTPRTIDIGPERRPIIAELRPRPLWNPMKMNGCALVAINPPENFAAHLKSVAADVVAVFGEPGGEARLWSL